MCSMLNACEQRESARFRKGQYFPVDGITLVLRAITDGITCYRPGRSICMRIVPMNFYVVEFWKNSITSPSGPLKNASRTGVCCGML